jgi:hydroxypyruvate reductase
MHTPKTPQRRDILAIFADGVAAADPYRAVKNALGIQEGRLHIGLDFNDPSKQRIGIWPRIHLLAFGKAACNMAAAALEIIPSRYLAGKGIVVTTYENITAVNNMLVLGAGHPLPDAKGLQAANIIAKQAQSAKAGELLLTLVSGGGSALLPAPVSAISLEEKIAVTHLLLACGADIQQINCVRKHLSLLKGGGLAKMAAPADLHALILSDVIGDDLSSIASGPTVADDTRFIDAITILKTHQAWEQVPESVRTYLQQGEQGLQPETPKSGAEIFKQTSHTLIGGNSLSIDAMQSAATRHKYHVERYSDNLCGEARIAAENLVLYAKKLLAQPVKNALAIVAGGETTVTLSAKHGKGGRNQEMALAFALAAEHHALPGNWTFLSGGTDGRDGPTDAAGGIVDNETLALIRQAGLDPQQMLDQHNAYPALQASNDLLITGPTGTNVADLQVLLMQTAQE